ncbi:MAG: hypothetical protein NTX61_18225 [Bacteroidetes bacterium]|nr:hypothetical protein [Bacteroidota bacterium]
MKSFLLFIVGFLCVSNIKLNGQDIITDSLTGVVIVFSAKDNMFPHHWNSAKIHAEAIPLDITEYKRAQDIIIRALAKYPLEILKKNLQTVFVLSSVSFYGVPYGGTSSTEKKAVYLTDDPRFGKDDEFMESLFHHEFAHILYNNYSHYLSKKKWKAANHPGFSYGSGGMEAIRLGDSSMDYDSLLNEQGFLNMYSQSSMDEDFHVFSQNLFNGGKKFWNIVDNHDKIRVKMLLIVRFYNRIDPLFTEAYFRNQD